LTLESWIPSEETQARHNYQTLEAMIEAADRGQRPTTPLTVWFRGKEIPVGEVLDQVEIWEFIVRQTNEILKQERPEHCEYLWRIERDREIKEVLEVEVAAGRMRKLIGKDGEELYEPVH
jgi:hypothetical protein